MPGRRRARAGPFFRCIDGYAGQTGDPHDGKFTLTLRQDPNGRWLIVSDMDSGNRSPR